MLSAKIRTAAITFVAAFSFASAVIVPTAAQARQKISKVSLCNGLQSMYELDTKVLEEDKAHHASKAKLEKDENHVTADLDKGEAAGCDISIWDGQPPAKHSPSEGLRPEGEPTSAPEPGSPPPTRPGPPPPVGSLA
jgi:hypothetical protein